MNQKQDFQYIRTLKSSSSVQKIPIQVYKTSKQASILVAKYISQKIKQKKDRPFVLGCSTGSTPVQVYQELVRMHKQQGLSFKNVIVFNLDQYCKLQKENPQSYHYFMMKHLIGKVDIPIQNFNILPGIFDELKTQTVCRQFQTKIKKCGGIDLQLLGIGRTGHIGFNQPPSNIDDRVRKVTLNKVTRSDTAPKFGGIDKVPYQALTLGIKQIMQAKQIIIMAWTQSKQYIVKKAIQQAITPQIPATFLQKHQNVRFIIDITAANLLSRFRAPWLIYGLMQKLKSKQLWDLKAVIWLAGKVNKPILRLQNQDYQSNNLLGLIHSRGNGYHQKCSLWAFKNLMKKITGWPAGGRPQGQTAYFDNKSNSPKKICIFSPHPDDDVICMGGTMKKLIDQGHQVNTIYQTSGNFAVFNHQAFKFVDFLRQLAISRGPGAMSQAYKIYQQVQQDILKGTIGPTLKKVKGLIRRSQARIAAMQLGVKLKNIYHLDLPFYETGSAKKGQITDDDVKIVCQVLNIIKPNIIYSAGDLSDPHGTHRICLQVLLKAMFKLRQEKVNWAVQCQMFFYRGSWVQWEVDQAQQIIPLSPNEVDCKKSSILRHQSQKDPPMFPGDDPRQFWQRARDRNRQSAQLLQKLGLVAYQGAQLFVSEKYLFKFI